MRNATWELATSRKIEETELQLALQCAPLIAGLKLANLLNIHPNGFSTVKALVEDSDISWHILFQTEEKMLLLLYHSESLKAYLSYDKVEQFFMDAGYHSIELSEILLELCMRYQRYMVKKDGFPHEMGLLLGYPLEDVTGFIENRGEHFLCSGYWKVYENRDRKLRMFESFENARESILKLLSCGISMMEIIHKSDFGLERSFG
jgi:hypothetical protein